MTTQEAIDYFGGVKELGAALGIWPQGIAHWKEHPPIPQQYHIYYKSNNTLLPEDLKNEQITVQG